MSRRTLIALLPRLTLLLALTGCGGGGGGDSAPPPPDLAPTNTLAYVDTACRDGADGFSAMQELRVRRGDSAPVTVARVPMIGPAPVPLVCGLFGQMRYGIQSLIFGAFQRLGVSPDGTALVFEVTDDFSYLGQSFVPPEQKGIFFIRVDGGGLRRLGDASRTPAFTGGDLGANFGAELAEPVFRFSPNGRLVDFTDMGPGPGGEDAAQVFILNLETGERAQVTHLPPAPFAGIAGTRVGAFLNNTTISFTTFSNPDGLNPDAKNLVFTVSIDDGELKALSTVAVSGGGGVIEVPVITGFDRVARRVSVPGVPVNPQAGSDIGEVFITDGTDVLQLTDFRRSDTSIVVNSPVVSLDGERVFFSASVDPPLGTNPLEICQMFSVDALGGDLRQLTRFGAIRHSEFGCQAGLLSGGCRADFNFNSKGSQDARTETLVFLSSCDPFGTNPNGEQIFAMRPDGSGLRALTDAHKLVRNSDRSVEAELPGPWSYGPHR